jgi:hypothetical protein
MAKIHTTEMFVEKAHIIHGTTFPGWTECFSCVPGIITN